MKAVKRRDDHSRLMKIGVFGGLTVVSGALSVVGLVNNSKGAVTRYNKLIATDQAGGDVEAALYDLRTYIYNHMNSEIGGPNGIYPPIQLKGTFDRLVAEEAARAESANETLYADAQKFCEDNGSQGFSGRNRLDCVNNYIDENGQSATKQEVQESLYKFDFIAPRWSADLAGFSLVAVVIFGLITAAHLIGYIRTKHFIHLAN